MNWLEVVRIAVAGVAGALAMRAGITRIPWTPGDGDAERKTPK
ncbi:hypothetical protein ABZ468_08065 [Streptomyces sp. NPDC005708]